MKRKAPEETRDRLLRAATEFIAAHGASNLTLDAVALAAGISKGGLLHHYPTKHALLRALMSEVGRLFSTKLEHALDAEPEGTPGRWTRAYVVASFECDPNELQLTAAIASIVAAEPELLEVIRNDFAWIDTHLEHDGLPSARALVIRMACDGLWLAELLELDDSHEAQRLALREELIALTRTQTPSKPFKKLEVSV